MLLDKMPINQYRKFQHYELTSFILLALNVGVRWFLTLFHFSSLIAVRKSQKGGSSESVDEAACKLWENRLKNANNNANMIKMVNI